ncbi:O-antigen ligase family protein [Sphingopyxis sp. 22461]|uniref:O-antigen ligase family protein n=1 Tax=Sphingopyxis sp. 22461 TaxID=3453923 RepID=UPI003F873795
MAARSDQEPAANRSASSPRASLLAWSIGLIPLIMLLTTWGDDLPTLMLFSKNLMIPVIALEISIIILAVRDGIKISRPPAVVSLSLVVLVIIAWTGALNSGSLYSQIQTFFWTVHLLFAMAIASLASKETLFAEKLVPAILFGFVGFAALFALFIASHYEQDRNWINDIPAYGNIRWLGFYAGAVFGLCALGWLRGRRSHALIAIIALALPLWTGARAPLAVVLGGYLAAYLMFPFARDGWRRFLAIVVIAIALAFVADWIAPLGSTRPQRIFTDMSSGGRTVAWNLAIQAIAERPWFGWGEGSFGKIAPVFHSHHPHNIILQITLAWGVIGGLAVGIITGWLTFRVFQEARMQTAPLLTATLMLAAASMIDGSLYFPQPVLLMIACVAALLSQPAPACSATTDPHG